ncbi:MAG: DUF4397 domain-containing protein [Chloroflexota bacterium]
MNGTTRRSAILAAALSAALVATGAIGAAAHDGGTAMIRVLHASPDAPAVDVWVDGEPVYTNIPFGVATPYIGADAGAHQVQVVAAGADPADGAVIDATIELAADTMTTVAVTHNLEAIEAQVIADAPAPVADAVQVRIGHLSADTPPVDIAPDGGDEIVQALAYPTVTDYLTIPEGQLDVELRPAGAADGWVALNPGGVLLANGHSYSIFAIGSHAEGTVRLLTVIDAVLPPPTAEVRVLHASPDAPAVDVYVDGGGVLTGVGFGAISDYLAVAPGEHEIQVYAAGADPSLEETEAVLDVRTGFEEGTRSTVVAGNVLEKIQAWVYRDDTATLPAKAKVRVIHLSPDAPAVDIAPDGAKVKKALIKGLAFSYATPYRAFPAGAYDLEVRAAGTADVAADLDEMSVEAGHNYTVFAIGSAADGSLTFLAAEDASAD